MDALLQNGLMVWQWLWDNLIWINMFLSVLIIFFQRRDPKAVWTWLLVLYFIPILGFFLYLVICQDMHKSHMFRVKEIEDGLNATIHRQEDAIRHRVYRMENPVYEEYRDLMVYNLEASGAVYTECNDIQIFTDGIEKFNDLLTEIYNAQEFIHIQYYIIRNDELFAEILQALKKKAKQGVEVRILYDDMGSRGMSFLLKEIQEAGIHAHAFFPATLKWFHLRLNYRNHRKIVVIDGRVGYVGGFNIGREYISKSPRFGYWRDTHLKLQGPSVLSLGIRFALDWNFASRENLFMEGQYFCMYPSADSNQGVQIITSGPDSKDQSIRNTYLRLIYKARQRIYIQSPYFIPDEPVLSALIIAAKSGVDVRIMIPCKPDHPFVYWASYSYIGDLLSAGAKCYTYQNGFLHAKGMTVDGVVSCYGTANMDIRSFQLNFEVNAVIYNEETTKALEDIFIRDMEQCKEITKEKYARRSWMIRIKEQVSRLLSPLL